MVEPINIGIFTVENFYEPQGGTLGNAECPVLGCEDEGDPAPESKTLRQDDVLQAI